VALIVPFHIAERLESLPSPDGSSVVAPELPAGSPQVRMLALFRELADRVAAEHPFLVYSGDCMAPLGVLAGLQRSGLSPFVVWLDAHGDFNTWETTPSGYIGGMPLAMLVGRGEQSIVQRLGLQTVVPSRILIADARDLDPEEGVALRSSGICAAPVDEIAQRVPVGLPIYVHLDVDVVTPSEMPALRYPAAGGPTLVHVGAALRALARTGRVVCATIACTWHPSHRDAAKAAMATDNLVASLSPER
jgi:arginase